MRLVETLNPSLSLSCKAFRAKLGPLAAVIGFKRLRSSYHLQQRPSELSLSLSDIPWPCHFDLAMCPTSGGG